MRSLSRIFSILLVVVSLAACREVALLEDLSQKDANEVIVLLLKNGIKPKREAVQKQQSTTWSIKVDSSDENKARELLVANHLPRQKELGLSGICKDAGLIPTPKTEKCRELLGIKGEIINSLETIPGVITTDVVINMPDKEDFPDPNVPVQHPTASVVVQIGEVPQGQDAITEAKIQQFVANAIPGMDMRDVAVIISRSDMAAPRENPVAATATAATTAPGPSSPPPAQPGAQPLAAPTPVISDSGTSGEEMVAIGGLRMDPDSAQKFKFLAVLLLVFFILLSGGLIIVLLRMARLRQRRGGGGGVHPTLPEKVTMDRLVEETGKQA